MAPARISARGRSASASGSDPEVLSGTASGPLLNGRILPGGADFQLIRHGSGDGWTTADIEARYVLETDDGARIYIVNAGVQRHTKPISRSSTRAAR